MSNEALLTRICAVIAAKNQDLRKLQLALNPLVQIAKFSAFEETANKALQIITAEDYDSAAIGALEDYLLDEIERETGMRLDALNEKALTAAISQRANVKLTSLTDAEIIKGDLMEEAANRIAERMGWALDAPIRTPDAFEAELKRRAANLIEGVLDGADLPKSFEPVAVRDALLAWGAKRIESRLRMPIKLGGLVAMEDALLAWAEPIVLRRMQEGGNAPAMKMTKKAIGNREAQRKFRAAHGDRKRYYPISL